MKIAHIAPFAPSRCGLYELARDMLKADIVGGHEVYFVDCGTNENGQHKDGKVGEVDDRGNFILTTTSQDCLNKVDLIFMHSDCPDFWLKTNDKPIIWVVHGRPLACFRPEVKGMGTNAYTLYRNVAKWQRSKAMLYFCPDYIIHWNHLFDGKDVVIDYPIVDNDRFYRMEEKSLKLNEDGKINVLLCDSEREDFCLYEAVVNLIECVKTYPEAGIKVHIFGVDTIQGNIKNAWDLLLTELKKVGGYGGFYGRLLDMNQVYNSMDLLVCPNDIITRTVAEALTCGLPVMQQQRESNMVSDYFCNFHDSKDFVKCFGEFLNNKGTDDINLRIERATVFSFENYNKKMSEVYEKIQSI